MVKIVTAEEEEKEELAAAWDEDENEMLVDFPRPSSPWEQRFLEYCEAYFSQNRNINVRSPPDPYYYNVFCPPQLWDFRDIPPTPPPCYSPVNVRSPDDHPCYLVSPPPIPPLRHFQDIFSSNFRLIIEAKFKSIIKDWVAAELRAYYDTYDKPLQLYAFSPNFILSDYRIFPHLVSINLNQATRLLIRKLQRVTDQEEAKATNKGYLSVGKYPGLLFSEEILETSGSVSDSQPKSSKGEICFLISCRGKTMLVYLLARMSRKECAALSVRVDIGDTDHPLSTLIAKTNRRITSLGKRGRAGNTFSPEDVPTHFAANFFVTACSMKRMCRQYADPQFLSPYLQKDERSLLEVKALEDYEMVSPRVFNQTSRNSSLLPVSSASTSQISNLNGCNQQSSSRSMSELMEQCQSFVFLGNSQVSVSHETPMQHMPEFSQEDSMFCPPQSEQLTRDTVLHKNHTFPPESTSQEEVSSRGTEKIDNIRKCHSFEIQSAVEGEAINIGEGDCGSTSQTVDSIGILLKKTKRKISRSIELEDLRPYIGKTTRKEAARSLGVSVSTLKRVCREHGIPRWPRKINKDEYFPSQLKGSKTGASVQSSLIMPFRGAPPSIPPVQAAVQFFLSDDPSLDPPPRQLSTVTVAQASPPERRMQDTNFVTIKATYDGTDTIIKFDLPSPATIDDLEREVAKRLKLNVGSFAIKYPDQEGDWISITCCDDLQYCIRTLRSLATIKMLVQSTTS